MKKIISTIIAVAMILGTMSFAAFAGEDYVAKIGDTGYQTLAEAIDKADDGDVVSVIAAGNYGDNITVDKAITLKGKDGVVFTGTITVRAEKAVLDGINLKYSGTRSEANGNVYGNVVIDADNVTVKNSSFYAAYDATSTGIGNEFGMVHMSITNNGTVFDSCTFQTNTMGIFPAMATGEIKNCTFKPLDDGDTRKSLAINGTAMTNVSITGNTFNGMRILTNGTGVKIEKNQFLDFTSSPVYTENFSANVVVDLSDNYWNGGEPILGDSGKLVAHSYYTVVNADGTLGGNKPFGVAAIGGKGYATLQEAIEKATETDVVVLLGDIELDETVEISEEDKITLDLNGYVIDGLEKLNIAVMSYGDLTIKDSSAEQTGTIKAGQKTKKSGNTINICKGKFTLEGGNIYSVNNALLIDGQTAEVIIKGGKITAEPTTNNSAALYVSSTSDTTITVNNGELLGYNGILLWNNTKINVTNGSISGVGSLGICGNGSKDATEINISGGVISGKYGAIYHPQGGTLNISGGSLSGWTGVVVKGGNINISGGEISATGEANTYQPVPNGYVDTGDALYVEHFDNSPNESNYGTPTVSITGGKFISVNNKAVASYANTGLDPIVGFISGGIYSTDVSAYLADGYGITKDTNDLWHVVDEKLLVDEIKVNFVPASDKENERVYNINLTANGKTINGLNSVDLTFALTQGNWGKNAFEIIAPNSEIAINPVNNSKVRYEFHYNGKTDVETDTNKTITIGQVKFTGYGKFSFAVDTTANDTNAAHATELYDSVVDSFVPGGAEDNHAETGELNIEEAVINNIEFEEATTKVTVVIEFNNNITEGNAASYNDMTVTLAGANGKIYTGKVGLNGGEADVVYADGADRVTFEFPEVTVGENGYYYTATVKGAGYRNASLTKRLTADLTEEESTYTFWNNVKDVEGDSFLAGDIVKDNIINIYDLSAVVSYFGEEDLKENNPKYAKYDLNRDGKIDSRDVAYVLVSWGR